MLYVSRVILNNELYFGVVDTDDGVEDIVEKYDLFDIVNQNGLRVHGVEPDEFGVLTVRPYQLPRYRSPNQVKFTVMYGVTIVTWRDMITALLWTPDSVLNPPVSLRLSDFGKCVGDCVFLHTAICGKHKVTIILDDSIEFTENSFWFGNVSAPSRMSLGTVFDLRDVSSDIRASYVYKVFPYYDDKFEVFDSVLDKPGRKAVIDLKFRSC